MYFILREEDAILERWKAGFNLFKQQKRKQDQKNGVCEGVRCYMA